jgi:nucleoid-associated protein YgaU
MFDSDSRYANVGNATLVAADGREIRYKKRRFLPRGETLPRLTEVVFKEGDRLDLIAGKTLGAPLHAGRIADANNALDPRDLLEPGLVLAVPVPQVEEER